MEQAFSFGSDGTVLASRQLPAFADHQVLDIPSFGSLEWSCDKDGRTNAWLYDSRGRLAASVSGLPVGGRVSVELYDGDAAGVAYGMLMASFLSIVACDFD